MKDNKELYERLRSIDLSLHTVAERMVAHRNDAQMIADQLERIANVLERRFPYLDETELTARMLGVTL